MNSLWTAFSTLTILPTPASNPTPQELKRSVLFFPLVGALLGGMFMLLYRLSLPSDLKTVIILLVWVAFSGAFHLDGLGDCLDGFFGGKDPQDRQRIMKAADLGTYGMTGITLTLIFKTVLLNHLLGQMNVSYWLLAIPIAARWAVCLSCFISKPPVGNTGLGSFVISSPLPVFLVGSLFALAGCFFLQKYAIGFFIITALISVAVSALSQKRIGGLTGDGLGATIELTEVALLFFACLNTSRFGL
ncbi:MAG TPA: adenosylcobinamide-GDP ribazoletransferase [bacterium]|jgi:adenosylcobinamide-GDP ribazoletransferase|nr:adenosylcobinamide-GDP ribazoletransferase [bacterium]